MSDKIPIHGVPAELQAAEIAKREKKRADRIAKTEARNKAEEDRQRMDEQEAPAGLKNASESEEEVSKPVGEDTVDQADQGN